MFMPKKIGVTFGEPWEAFYAIGYLDELEINPSRRRSAILGERSTLPEAFPIEAGDHLDRIPT